MARDAVRISSLATSQAERIDRLVTDLTKRVEQSATTVHAVLRPLRDGAAVISGVKTAIDVFLQLMRRSASGANRGGTEDDDGLFIG